MRSPISAETNRLDASSALVTSALSASEIFIVNPATFGVASASSRGTIALRDEQRDFMTPFSSCRSPGASRKGTLASSQANYSGAVHVAAAASPPFPVRTL